MATDVDFAVLGHTDQSAGGGDGSLEALVVYDAEDEGDEVQIGASPQATRLPVGNVTWGQYVGGALAQITKARERG